MMNSTARLIVFWGLLISIYIILLVVGASDIKLHDAMLSKGQYSFGVICYLIFAFTAIGIILFICCILINVLRIIIDILFIDRITELYNKYILMRKK